MRIALYCMQTQKPTFWNPPVYIHIRPPRAMGAAKSPRPAAVKGVCGHLATASRLGGKRALPLVKTRPANLIYADGTRWEVIIKWAAVPLKWFLFLRVWAEIKTPPREDGDGDVGKLIRRGWGLCFGRMRLAFKRYPSGYCCYGNWISLKSKWE